MVAWVCPGSKGEARSVCFDVQKISNITSEHCAEPDDLHESGRGSQHEFERRILTIRTLHSAQSTDETRNRAQEWC